MLSCLINTAEERDNTKVDIPGAFMQANMDKVVYRKLEGTMAELLVRLDPKLYHPYLRAEDGRTVMHIQLRKALYGTLKAALLFWKNLLSTLAERGFEINQYGWCITNKIIDDKQCTTI
eukprot:11425345-Ditylum_brightwellii.AAC.1